MLELRPPTARRTSRRWPTSRSPRTRSRTSSSPTAASPTSSSGASARSGCRSPPRSSIACCPAPTRARAGSSRSPPGWSPAGEIAGDTLRLLDRARHAAPVDDRRDGPRGRRVGPRDRARRRAAQRAARRRRARPSRRAWPTRGSATTSAGADFVTGQVARIDLRSGTATIVNAGHPPPLRLRDGRVETVALEADPPFGARARITTTGCSRCRCEPGDRLMFLTDGMMERNAADRRHRGADGRGRGHAPARGRAAPRARPARRPPTASSRTTRPSCASTGTAARRAGARATRVANA